LWVDEDRLDPDERLPELERERDEDDRLLDLFEELPLERLFFLLLDLDFCWGILPGLLVNSVHRVRRLPESRRSTLTQPAVQICCSPGRSRWTAGAKGAAGKESQVRG
jgi:hypothetical protein